MLKGNELTSMGGNYQIASERGSALKGKYLLQGEQIEHLLLE